METENSDSTVRASAFLIARDLISASIPLKHLRPFGKKKVADSAGNVREFEYDYDFKIAVTAVSIARGIDRQLQREDERERLDSIEKLDDDQADAERAERLE